MKKAMFHKFTNFIQHAVETFAPNISPQEEFVYHWKSVTSYFVDNKDGGARIEETALPEHLMSMLRIIQEEESELGEAGTTGVCLEYLLQHRLLETLYTLGRTDHPPGMKQVVLSFFTKLLSRISHPLLPHINVHRAVQRLIKACGETKAGPTEKEEIEFLCTVCAKIKSDPYLVNFFIENPRQATDKRMRPPQVFSLVDALLVLSFSEDARVSVKACEGLMLCASLPEKSASTALVSQTQFCKSIANTLCQLYEKLPNLVNPDNIECLEAKWGFDDIIERSKDHGFAGRHQVISFLSWLDYCDQLISIANPQVGEALALEIHKTLLSESILPQLLQPSESGEIVATTYITRCLRTVCSPALLREFCYFLLGNDRAMEVKDSPEHPLKKRLLERCNHLSEEVCIATLKLFDTLLQKENEHIFHCLLLRNLLGRSYLQGTSATGQNSCATTVLENSNKDPVNSHDHQEFVDHPERPSGVSAFPDHHQSPGNFQEDVPASLPEQISESKQSPDPDYHVDSTESMCEKSQSATVDNSAESMPLCNSNQTPDVSSQNNQTSEAEIVPDISSLSTDQADSSIAKDSLSSADQSSSLSSSTIPGQSASSVSSSLSSGFASPVFIHSDIHKVVNSFLSLLPEEAKSSFQTTDSGYDMYLRDAHKQFAIQETVCKDWAWPNKPLILSEYMMEKFYEGSFLHMLLDKLLHLLDQSYSVNLLLTALIAKVALIPHPNLHEFLLDPFLPTIDGTRTLYSALVKVSNDIKHHQKSDPTFCQKLVMARKQLLGIVPTIHSLRARHYRPDTQ